MKNDFDTLRNLSNKFPNGILSFRSLCIESSSNASKYLLITKKFTFVFFQVQQNLYSQNVFFR